MPHILPCGALCLPDQHHVAIATDLWSPNRMDRAEAVDEAPARWIDTTADSANGRHLGPTLEEISELRASRALERPAPEKPKPEAESEATDAPRVREDRPSEEQLRALANLGVTETPQSKEHAMFLIREAREMQLAEGLGFATTNRRMGRLVPVDGALGADTQAEAEQVIANYTQSEEDSHLNLVRPAPRRAAPRRAAPRAPCRGCPQAHPAPAAAPQALRGINGICRRPQ